MARGRSSSKAVKCEVEGLVARLKAGDAKMAKAVTTVVANYTDALESGIRRAISVPVNRVNRRGKKISQRSRPGQPPRKDTGRYVGSLKKKLSPKGYVGAVSTGDSARDKKGRRYPWMVESGTQHMRKRPAFKRVQRELKKPFVRDLVSAARAAIRST